jgi:uncharacterized protein YjbI with pentapeptide repeats
MKPLIKRLVTLTAAVALPATLLTGPIASPAQAAEAAEAPSGTYNQKVTGLKRLQATGGGPNQFSLSAAPQVGWDAGLEMLGPPAASMYRLWDMKVAWKDVNPAQGVFNWSELDRRVALVESWGGKPLLVLGLTPQWAATDPAAGDPRWGAGTASPPKNITDWNDYVRSVATRYGARIAGYELWNEANLNTFWQGSTEKLYEMAVSASSLIKVANPAAVVLAPSTTTRLRTSARNFTSSFAGQIPKGERGPFDAWTIHSYPTGQAGLNLDNATKIPRAAADKRVDDILNWQNALVDAVGSDSPALDIDIYDTEVNYGLKGPGYEPGSNWSADDATRLMNMTYQDNQNLGINATFWYQFTARPYDLLGVQWNYNDRGLYDLWNTMRSTGVPPISGPSFLYPESAYNSKQMGEPTGLAIPSFKNCFIRLLSDCSGQKLKGIDLSGMPSLAINFTDAYLGNANLRNTHLSGSNFKNAYLGNANLRDSVIQRSAGLNSETSIFYELTNLNARSFYKADFSGALLTDVKALKGKFYGTKWDGANLASVNFESANFRTADFSNTQWYERNSMKKTGLNNTIWNNATCSQRTTTKTIIYFQGATNFPGNPQWCQP